MCERKHGRPVSLRGLQQDDMFPSQTMRASAMFSSIKKVGVSARLCVRFHVGLHMSARARCVGFV